MDLSLMEEEVNGISKVVDKLTQTRNVSVFDKLCTKVSTVFFNIISKKYTDTLLKIQIGILKKLSNHAHRLSSYKQYLIATSDYEQEIIITDERIMNEVSNKEKKYILDNNNLN